MVTQSTKRKFSLPSSLPLFSGQFHRGQSLLCSGLAFAREERRRKSDSWSKQGKEKSKTRLPKINRFRPSLPLGDLGHWTVATGGGQRHAHSSLALGLNLARRPISLPLQRRIKNSPFNQEEEENGIGDVGRFSSSFFLLLLSSRVPLFLQSFNRPKKDEGASSSSSSFPQSVRFVRPHNVFPKLPGQEICVFLLIPSSPSSSLKGRMTSPAGSFLSIPPPFPSNMW